MKNSDAERLPEACPVCGTAYPTGAAGARCPVCLMGGALGSEPEDDSGLPGDEPSPADKGRFDHYALVRAEGGSFEELGRGPWA